MFYVHLNLNTHKYLMKKLLLALCYSRYFVNTQSLQKHVD